MRIRAIAVLVGLVLALGVAAPAFAGSVYYGSASAPIKAENNTDDGNAWLYGAVMVKDQTWLRNRYWYRDSAPGGNAAYVQSDWYFYGDCDDGTSCFRYSESDRSSDTNSGDWRVEEDYVDLVPSSDTGRARTKVCENQNNSPDACSKIVIATLTY